MPIGGLLYDILTFRSAGLETVVKPDDGGGDCEKADMRKTLTSNIID